MEAKEKIRAFIEEHLTVFEDEVEINEDDSIFELGYVNSLFAMQLVMYLEQEFGIAIENTDLDIRKNFRSIKRIAEFVESKTV